MVFIRYLSRPWMYLLACLVLIWRTYLISGPIIFVVAAFFQWPEQDYIYNVNAYANTYILVTFFTTLWLLFRRRKIALPPALALLCMLFLCYFASDWIEMEGFRFYIGSTRHFLRDHCKVMQFFDGKKPYKLGICNVKYDEDGQISSNILIYDQSGEVKNDAFAKSANGTKDRIEWVNAMRILFNDDPNEPFESSDFYSHKIYGDFYCFYYGNFEEAGFSVEYGPPPPNAANKYQSLFDFSNIDTKK